MHRIAQIDGSAVTHVLDDYVSDGLFVVVEDTGRHPIGSVAME